jgi:hypothetical protein
MIVACTFMGASIDARGEAEVLVACDECRCAAAEAVQQGDHLRHRRHLDRAGHDRADGGARSRGRPGSTTS